MEVPDFTPLFNRRAVAHPRKSRLSSGFPSSADSGADTAATTVATDIDPTPATPAVTTTTTTTTTATTSTAAATPAAPAVLPRRPVFPAPVKENAPFASIQDEEEEGEDRQKKTKTF